MNHNLLQGTLSFSSEGVGHGSSFFLELPLYSETTAEAALRAESLHDEARNNSKKNESMSIRCPFTGRSVRDFSVFSLSNHYFRSKRSSCEVEYNVLVLFSTSLCGRFGIPHLDGE